MTASHPAVCFTLRLPARTGAPRMALSFATSFRDAGYEVVLVHGNPPSGEPAITDEFVDIGAECIHDPRFENALDPRLVRNIASIASERGATCVIGVNQRDRVPALRAANRAGVAGVLMVQNQHRFGGNRLIAEAKRRVYGSYISRMADLAVCTSEVVRSEILSLGVAPDRAVVLPNGISIDKPVELGATRADIRAGLGGDHDRLLLINVGRLDRQKGQDILLEALGMAPDLHDRVRLAMVGPDGAGPSAKEHMAVLDQLVDRHNLGDVVMKAGWRTDIPEILAASDGYVHSARWEGPAMPLSVLEAMAAGVPTVFTDCSGTPDGFVMGRHGWIASAGDPRSLIDSIRSLVDCPSTQLKEVAEAGRQFVTNGYRVEDLGRRFVSLVEKLSG